IGHLDPADLAPGSSGNVVNVAQPTYSGTVSPGAKVWLFAGPAHDPSSIAPVGSTTAASDGSWSITTSRPLPDGTYRLVAMASPVRQHHWPRWFAQPTAPLGTLVVESGPSS